jgi:gluconolactonase
MRRDAFTLTLFAGAALSLACAAFAGVDHSAAVNPYPAGVPDAIVDLRKNDTAALVAAEWSTQPFVLEHAEFPMAGDDLKPSGMKGATHAVAPLADWLPIEAASLEKRRSAGRFAGQWYRLAIMLPKALGAVGVDGATVVLEVVVDDYAEVRVDGKLPLVLGGTAQSIGGWNTPQRVLVTSNAKAGDHFVFEILAHNGPLSAPPENFVWFRSATLDVFAKSRGRQVDAATFTIEAADPALAKIVTKDAKLERIATGFTFTEGPCVLSDGSIVFSDPNRNTIFRWSEADGVTVYRAKSGYTGVDIGRYRQAGSNGLALDPEGRLTICEHGNRRVTRLEKNGVLTVLADSHEGKRLNSPNDLVYRKDGVLFFTDPPFGLPGFHDDPAREAPHFGVYAWKDGKTTLLVSDLRGPNGLDLSPDEKHLYVANWDEQKKIVTRHTLDASARVTDSSVFADLTDESGEEALDGLEVDLYGNVFVSGPGGVYVFDAAGKKLGKIVFPELPANFTFTDATTRTMILAARTGLYRLTL